MGEHRVKNFMGEVHVKNFLPKKSGGKKILTFFPFDLFCRVFGRLSA
jgi:hypothetical protein